MALMQLFTGSVTLVSDKLVPKTGCDTHSRFFIGRGLPSIQGITANIETCPKHLSKFHAVITYSGGEFYLQDLNSLNGTYVNNTLYRGGEPIRLPDFCLIKFGGNFFLGSQTDRVQNPLIFIFCSECDEKNLPLDWRRPVITSDQIHRGLGLLASALEN
jgi:pSer/pThr/pTyr-binding forkhead associated (FHA) protein